MTGTPTPAQVPLADQEIERLALFISSITDYAIYMLSPEGRVASWNAGAQRFKGYAAQEIIGQHFSRFYTDEERQAGVPAFALQQARDAGKFEAEGWRVRKDGTRFWASVVIDPIRDEHQQLIGFAKITRDISERKAAQAELEAAREALFQSQKLEAIGKLTGGVAHDFNNLLNVVSNGLSMMRKRTVQAADIRLIETMDLAVRRGASLTQQLLSFARQQPLARERRDLNRVIRSFESVLLRAGRNGTVVALQLAPALPSAEVDAAQVETALLNLVVNADDATASGGSIIVSTSVRSLAPSEVKALPAGHYVTVTVQDSGHGMPLEVQRRAVEPFYTTKPAGKGTGLGLSQVYGMVRQSGGDLLIESAPEQGTAITLFFPAVTGHDASDGEPAHASHQVETVLVVDDQPDVLDITSELFRSLGFEVLSADSGEKALELLGQAPGISLLFSDVVMRGMSGVELARHARQLVPDLRIILASGFAGASTPSQSAEQIEGFPFLAKPYRVNDLMRKLRTVG